MNITDLEKSGGFVPDELVKRTLSWDDQTGEVFVRRTSFATAALMQTLPLAERIVETVRECIRLGDGDVQLTPEQARSLKPSLADAMLDAVAEVNGFNKEPDPKN